MPQSLGMVLVHVIFSTKNRARLLQSPNLRREVHAYLAAILRNLQCQPLQVGGTEDHVHLLSGFSRNISLAELIKTLKISSTKMLRDRGHRNFGWQTGYGVFSVSASAKESVVAYIAKQEMHHRKMSFQEELRAILTKHGVAFDERLTLDMQNPES
jgi:putative transposase